MNHSRVDGWFAGGGFDTAESRVTDYRMHESISELFEIEFHLALADDLPMDLDAMQEMLDGPAAFAFGESHAVGQPVYGVLREWELVDCVRDHESLYRGVLVPALWYTTQTHRSRVFQDLSLPDLVQMVLEEHGLVSGEHFELDLSGTYPSSEYIVQHEESDFDFLARRLEYAGVSFWFDFSEGTDRVVFTDANPSMPLAEASLPYEEAPPVAEYDYVRQLRRTLRVVPRRVVLRDSNYRTPQVPLQSSSDVHSDGMGLVALYGDHFKDDGEGARLAEVRAQEIAVERQTLRAAGYVRSLHAGQRVELRGHPVSELDQTYVVTSVSRRSSSRGEGVEHRFTLVPDSVPFRPARATRTPRIDGFVHARIDGEVAGTPAPLDEQGRYRVLLPFDAHGETGGRATRWMRRAQVYAGPGYGMHFPLHIGTEVLIGHVEGDPDRPFIAAALPNPATASPVVQDNATQSVVRTKGNIVQEYEDDA